MDLLALRRFAGAIVLLDADLAAICGVEAGALDQALAWRTNRADPPFTPLAWSPKDRDDAFRRLQ